MQGYKNVRNPKYLTGAKREIYEFMEDFLPSTQYYQVLQWSIERPVNALKYSDGDFSVELHDDGQIIFKNHARSLDKLRVEKLFDRFYTVQEARGSTGLGLSIARSLVEQLGGSIWAEYEDGVLKIVVKL